MSDFDAVCSCRSKFGVKESQSLARIPDTLVYAMEFITMATPADQQKALDDLRLEVLHSHSELKVPQLPPWFSRKRHQQANQDEPCDHHREACRCT